MWRVGKFSIWLPDDLEAKVRARAPQTDRRTLSGVLQDALVAYFSPNGAPEPKGDRIAELEERVSRLEARDG